MALVGIATALALISVLFVLYPLWQRGTGAVVPASDGQQDMLTEQRKAAYDAMAELDFDRELGKLDESDYRSLYERYRRQAVAALEAAREREAVLSARIDQQVQQARTAVITGVDGSEHHASIPSQARAQPSPVDATGRNHIKWLTTLGVVFALFASATIAVYVRGAQSAEDVAAVGAIPGDDFAGLLIDAREGRWVLAGDSLGIRRSTDRGTTWSAIPLLPGSVTALAQDVGNPARVYALVDSALQRSDDSGMTWKRVGSTPARSRLTTLAADPGRADTLYATDQAGGVFVSRDAGTSWRRLRFEAAGATTSITVAVPRPLAVFIAAEQGVLLGTDGRWSSANGVLNGALPTRTVYTVVFDRSTGDRSMMPGGMVMEGTLYAATDRGICRSTDFGVDWFRLGPDADIRAVAVGPPGSRLMLAVGSAGEVYRSTDRGVT